MLGCVTGSEGDRKADKNEEDDGSSSKTFLIKNAARLLWCSYKTIKSPNQVAFYPSGISHSGLIRIYL